MKRSWRMPEPCANCPFRQDGAQIELTPGRLDDIKDAVLIGQPFSCHKTVHSKAGRRSRRNWLECAGALEYRRLVGADPAAISAALHRIIGDLL